ncbi:MAG: YedE-related selenium metabolism membrane protein [Desulfobacterales bacterium]|nr:YedE-related selenium metabolism membrane protein [Desulfobacterales bacterium]
MKAFQKMLDASIVTGALLGLGGVFLTYFGNPVNSGICVSCFVENIAGALQLHNDPRMSYIRPELIGFLLGSFLVAVKTGRFRVRGGSSSIIRFFVGFFIIVGCAVFIGCPIKMILRLAAGDLTAIAATLGLIFGVWLGVRHIKGGFVLDQPRELPRINGFVIPLLAIILLIFLLVDPAFIKTGQKGPAAWHAPVYVSLLVGLAIGVSAQRSGLCITGGLRNFFLAAEKTLLTGVLTAFLVALIAGSLLGQFSWGMNAQPASHLSHGWTFLAMTMVGLASILIDGCPFRQLIKAGEGDVDAGITTLGMLLGGGFTYAWTLRSTSAGPTFEGKIVVLAGLVFSLVIAMAFRKRSQKKKIPEGRGLVQE